MKMCMNKCDAKKIILDNFAVFLNLSETDLSGPLFLLNVFTAFKGTHFYILLAMFKQLFICISFREKQADRTSRKQDLSLRDIVSLTFLNI